MGGMNDFKMTSKTDVRNAVMCLLKQVCKHVNQVTYNSEWVESVQEICKAWWNFSLKENKSDQSL